MADAVEVAVVVADAVVLVHHLVYFVEQLRLAAACFVVVFFVAVVLFADCLVADGCHPGCVAAPVPYLFFCGCHDPMFLN